MIVVTGAAGFIGSCLLAGLKNAGYADLVAVDDFSNPIKNKNLDGKELTAKVDRKDFFKWIEDNHRFIQFIFHLGARTDTTEFNHQIFQELNVDYSKRVWNLCAEFGLPLAPLLASLVLRFSANRSRPFSGHQSFSKIWRRA